MEGDEVTRAMDELLDAFAQRDQRTPEENLAATEARLADDVVATDWLLPGRELDKAGLMKEFYEPIYESFPDVRFEVFDTMRDGNRLLVCGYFIGTLAKDHDLYQTTFVAHQAKVRWEARDIYRFRGSKIDRIWYANDTLSVAREMDPSIRDFRSSDPGSA